MRFERKVKGCTSVVRQARRAALAAVSGVAGTAVRGVFGAFVGSALGVLVGVLVLVGGVVGGLIAGAVGTEQMSEKPRRGSAPSAATRSSVWTSAAMAQARPPFISQAPRP